MRYFRMTLIDPETLNEIYVMLPRETIFYFYQELDMARTTLTIKDSNVKFYFNGDLNTAVQTYQKAVLSGNDYIHLMNLF